MLGATATSLTLLGLASYSIARAIVDGFLGRLGLNYQDVGLQYTDLVANGALFTLPIGIGFGAFLAFREVQPRMAVYRRRVLLVFILMIVNVTATLSFFVLSMIAESALQRLILNNKGSSSVSVLLTLVVLVSTGVFGMWVIVDSAILARRLWPSTRSGRPTEPTISMSPLPAQINATIVLMTMGLILAFCIAGHSYGQHLAGEVKDRQAVAARFLGLKVPGLRAQPSLLIGVNSIPASSNPNNSAMPFSVPGKEECLLFLGGSDGVNILFRPSTGDIVRVAAESAAVSVLVGRTGC